MKKLSLILIFFLTACGKDVDKSFKNNPNTPPSNCALPCSKRINGPLSSNGDVTEKFAATQTPNGPKVVYIADEDLDGIEELYVANPDGTQQLKLNYPLLNAGKNVIRFKISPNGLKVAYIADQDDVDKVNLYTVNLDGSQRHLVNSGVPTTAHEVASFEWMPSSSKLVYTTDEFNAAGTLGLYIANFDGTSRLTLSSGPVASQFAIAPNGSRVVYKFGALNPVARSIIPDATGDVLLNTPFNLITFPASSVSGFVISPSSTKVVYRSNHDDDSKFELFSVNIDGTGSRVKLNSSLVIGGNVGLTPGVEFAISPDSSKVVYLADQDVNNVTEIYSASLGVSGSTKLNSALTLNGDVESFKITPDSTKVVYMADKDVNGANEIFSVDISGGSEVKINTDLLLAENVAQYAISPNNSTIVYSMDKGNPSGVFSLFKNNLSGSNEVELTPALALSATGVYDSAHPNSEQFKITNDSLRVIFRGSLTSVDHNLYNVNLDGSNFNVINPPVSGENVVLNDTSLGTSFLILPQGIAVYRFSSSQGINLFGGTIP